MSKHQRKRGKGASIGAVTPDAAATHCRWRTPDLLLLTQTPQNHVFLPLPTNHAQRTCALVSRPLEADMVRAAAPATYGAAMDVPVRMAYSWPMYSLRYQVDRMSVPGAASWTVVRP